MPQVVFSPTSQNDTTLNELAFRAMSENLAQNIDYRRKQQTRKATVAQDMEAKMAAGLMPESAMKVTDEGFEFANDAAKKSFYERLGAMMGRPEDDMNQKGFTNIIVDPNADAKNRERYQEGVAAAVESAKGDEEVQRVSANTADMFDAAKKLQFTGISPTDDPDAGQQTAAANLGMVNNLVMQNQQSNLQAKQQSLQQALQGSALLAPQAAQMQAQQVGNVPLLTGQTITVPGTTLTNVPPGQTVTTPGTTLGPVNTRQSQTTRVGTGASGAGATSAISEMDQIQASYKRPGYKYKQDDYALQETTKQAERRDELRTSLRNLMGLAAFENYGNQLMRVADPNSISNNTFGAMAEKRAADLIRWEAAGAGEGVSQAYQKVGERSTEVDAAEYSINAVRKDALKQQNNINIGGTVVTTGANTTTLGASSQQPKGTMRTLAGVTGVEGVDFNVRPGGTIIWNKQFDINALEPRFKTGGKVDVQKTAKQLISNVRLGGTEPEERNLIMEMGAGPQKAYYSVAKNGWFSDPQLTQKAGEPSNKTYIKLYLNNTGNQIGDITNSDFRIRSFSERMANNLLDTQRSGATTSAGATLNNPTP